MFLTQSGFGAKRSAEARRRAGVRMDNHEKSPREVASEIREAAVKRILETAGKPESLSGAEHSKEPTHPKKKI